MLNSLPVEYESVVESLKKDLELEILILEALKEQVRSKYRWLIEKMNLKDNYPALTSQVDKNRNIHKNDSIFKKNQKSKCNCRICGKY